MNSKDARTDDTGGRGRRPAGRVVISSLTGKPMDWEPEAGPAVSAAGGTPTPRAGTDTGSEPRRPILPDRVDEDQPEPGESNDARLAGDVPPHWGRGR